jgi:serine protease Do
MTRFLQLQSLFSVALLCAAIAMPAAEPSRREQLKKELFQASDDLARLSRAVNLIHELVAPSVLSIHTKQAFLVTNFRTRQTIQREVEVGEGSGFVFYSNNEGSWIVTNAHVVARTDADQQFVIGRNGQPVVYDTLQVILTDNRELTAEFVGIYVESDLAVLKVKEPNLPALEWADSDQAKVGDWVVALGYPLGVGYSATSGIVSATDRSIGIYQNVGGFDSFIQTDAAINPGNSGGPLVDIHGRVLGINSSIKSSTGANIGLGFAIPANLSRRIADDLRTTGRVRRPMVGVGLDDLPKEQIKALGLPQASAVVVNGIIPDGPAARAGLKKGDVILGINQSRVTSLQQFQSRVASSTLGQPITLRIWRAGSEIELPLIPISEDEINAKMLAAAAATAERQGVPLVGFGLWLAVDDQAGLSIVRVESDSIAERAGLKTGDRLLHERAQGPLRSIADARALNGRTDLILQVYQDGRSYWLRLRR